jgi:putative nucleotidyltransferase with HDIG domain
MANDFLPVTTKFIYYFTGPLPFDVYIQLADDKYTKIYHKNSEHDPNQIYRYENKDLKILYVSNEEKNLFGSFLCELIDQFNTGKGTIDKAKMIDIMKTSLELTYEKIISENDELETNMQWATHQVKGALHLLEDDISSAIEVFKALAGDIQLLKHSYMVSLFSLVLAKKLGINNPKNLMNIGLGALLHDVGHTRVNKELFTKQNLTPKEWEEIKDHPQIGLKIVDFTKGISSDIRSIIMQHHEQYNGRGYPNRLNNSLIFPPAKIVAIADGFCSLLSKASYGDTQYSADQAIKMMKDDIGHYDPEFLNTFEMIIIGDKKKNSRK